MNKTVKLNNIIRVFHCIKQMNKSNCINYIPASKENTYKIFNSTNIPVANGWVATTQTAEQLLYTCHRRDVQSPNWAVFTDAMRCDSYCAKTRCEK